ncbi:MAG: hypothetical protein LC685_04380 [Actinobacteria bacterium]|nr:hypothetical protein [Actinomycetota bacterium]
MSEEENRARELEALRRERAKRLAIETAVAAERVQGRLLALEEHKRTVNGQIGRLADAQERMNAHLGRISEEMKVAKDVNEALIRHADASGAKRLTAWQKWGLVVTALVGVGTVVLLLIQTLHGLGH